MLNALRPSGLGLSNRGVSTRGVSNPGVFNRGSSKWLLLGIVLFVGVWHSAGALALTLGNLQIISKDLSAFQAKIAIISSPQEIPQIQQLTVQFPAPEVFVQLGLKNVSPVDRFELGIEKSADGVPISIVISSQKLLSSQALFEELVLQVSWQGGKLVRVYTLLNPQVMAITVNRGDNLSKITESLIEELPNANFDQVLTAIFRLNPNAFIAGNIHRLKVGAVLEVPTSAMVESIPRREAKLFSIEAQTNFQNKRFNEPSEKSVDRLSTAAQDRLQLSSAKTDSENNLIEAKLDEELIAQKKILEQAQSRINEIQKNIADLKQIQSGDQSSLYQSLMVLWEHPWMPKVAGILAGMLLLIYGVYSLQSSRSASRVSSRVSSSSVSEPFKFNVLNGLNERSQLSPPSISNRISDEISEEMSDDLPGEKPGELPREMPEFARNIFNNLDLNLDGPASSDNITSNITSPSDAENKLVHRNIPSVTDQKLRLNLAKSYIKIQDFATAKILLAELVALKASGQSDIVREAQKHLIQIA